MKRLGHAGAWVLAALLARSPASAATLYQAGEVIDDFTLTHRDTREPVRLADFAGKIVFLEWFAWWCPFCQASAPQVAAGIVDWYHARGGNPAGIPVEHVAINLQPNQEAQTQNFVTRAGFDLVLEDFSRSLANRFQIGGQPIFAIINGVTNSPSHAAWELLLHQDGYGQRDFSESILRFRAAIDAVQAPPSAVPPRFLRTPGGQTLTEGDTLRLEVEAEGTPPLHFAWSRNDSALPAALGPVLEIVGVTPGEAGAYTVRVSNEAGAVVSEPIAVTVLRRTPVPPRITGVEPLPEGRLRLAFTPADGSTIPPVIEVSGDLRSWTVVEATERSDTAEGRSVTVRLQGPRSFYRLRDDSP